MQDLARIAFTTQCLRLEGAKRGNIVTRKLMATHEINHQTRIRWIVVFIVIDDLGMRKLPMTAAEDLLEIVMRRYERASTLLTSNRPVEDWGKLLGDSAAVTAMLDRLLHHGHVLKCGPRSWRTKTDLLPQQAAG